MTIPKMIETFTDDKIVSIQCGIGHTIAITSTSKVYSWGDASNGQLGHGLSKETRLCHEKDYPNKIHKGINEHMNGKSESDKDNIVSAGSGKNINVVVMSNGKALTWGKGEYQNLKFNDLKKFSKPREI